MAEQRPIKLRGAGFTVMGRARKHIDDGFVADAARGLYAVSDGFGPRVSPVGQRVCDALAQQFDAAPVSSAGVYRSPGAALQRAARLEAAVHAIHRELRALSDTVGGAVSAVLTALVQDGDTIALAHIGDARCYRLRDGALTRLTRDHTYAEDPPEELAFAVAAGFDAASLPAANVLTRTLGLPLVIALELLSEPLREGDWFLLCTDGVHLDVPEARLREALLTGEDLGAVCALLRDAIADAPSADDASAVVVQAYR